ncbi:MAG: tetratricopeptide repeat protein [Treponema sp.]|nr:tetratricopeptide repeat protein [Treponema sp.]MCL2236669.1 tetratricopeptide repeat protein [Treponema sp.]
MKKVVFLPLIFISCFFLGGCAGSAASAEEYFAIGMAYFELGKYEEAEKWLTRARQSNRTMVASTYNLGRLAFEMGRYEDAARHFESILRRDRENVLALKAAAYSRIMTGDMENAERHYAKLLELVPESADSGYNHALVLFAMERYADAETVLERYPVALLENNDNLLLYARVRAALNKVEAIDHFAAWLETNSNPKVRYEFGQSLEKHNFYARALGEYRKAYADSTAASVDPKRSDVRFAIARVLLIADGSSGEGITELQGAITEGFNNIASVEGLVSRVSGSNRETIRNIINSLRQASETNP